MVLSWIPKSDSFWIFSHESISKQASVDLNFGRTPDLAYDESQCPSLSLSLSLSPSELTLTKSALAHEYARSYVAWLKKVGEICTGGQQGGISWKVAIESGDEKGKC